MGRIDDKGASVTELDWSNKRLIKLNCDLGESFGSWKMGHDELIMPHIDMANIACGFHAGDAMVMTHTLKSAIAHNVEIGAHPSYPDLQGFGRRSMKMNEAEIVAMVQYQIGALEGIARTLNSNITYVKPHGALYNDMMRNPSVFRAIVKAVSGYSDRLALLIQYTPDYSDNIKFADKYKIKLLSEAFADRLYQDDGTLSPRSLLGAVLDEAELLKQAHQLIQAQSVSTAGGKILSIKADTICVHGDSLHALQGVKDIRKMLST